MAHSTTATTHRRRPAVARLALVVGGLLSAGALVGTGLAALGTDIGPPAPRISSGPARTTTARTATFAIDSAPDTQLECSLDGVAFTACRTRVTLSGLVLGPHALRVRALAGSGARSDPTSYGWRIVPVRELATTLVRPVLTSTPLRPYTSRSATFAWRWPARAKAPAGVRFSCQLDAGRWLRCRSPRTYRDLADGPHAFAVRAVAPQSAPGHANRFRWTIALEQPGAPTITLAPPTTTSSTQALIAWDGDAAGFECSVDDGQWQPCSSPVVLVGLTPGAHVLCVRALSSLGVAGPPSCVRWTTTSSTGGAGPAPPGSGSFSLSGDVPTLLAPGVGGALPLTIVNPNGFDLRVTDIAVTVASGSSRPGCNGTANLDVSQSNAAGGGASLVVPADGAVTLPAQGVTEPVVSMLDLPVDQSACKGATFTLTFAATGSQA